MTLSILIVEDEDITRKHIVCMLQEQGHNVDATNNGKKAFDMVQTYGYDLLVADIKVPGMDGMELLEKVKETYPDTEVMIITGYGSIGSAVDAMKKGALDYLPKPIELDELILKINKLRDQRDLKRENIALKTHLNMEKEINMVAESKNMKHVLELIKSIENSDCSVLLTGESGVGKNLVAKAIHYSSHRKNKPLLFLNCATFTENLLASELFGHEKGAFTGAVSKKQGLMEIANGGTLYLDEIAEMPPNLQAKLLKVVEEKEFYRVGGNRPLRVDIRFISATNQNINEAIQHGTFRHDLYYRLNVMEIHIPPLRDRSEDMEILCKYLLQKHLDKHGKNIKGFSEKTMHILKKYSFPGNVRELENLIERAVILETGSYISPESLPQSVKIFQIEALEPEAIKPLEEKSKEYARSVVEMVDGNKAKAARLLGISRTSLWRMLKDD